MQRDGSLTMARISLVTILSLPVVLMPASAFTTTPPQVPPLFLLLPFVIAGTSREPPFFIVQNLCFA